MSERSATTTAAIVDGLLRFIATGGFITTALVLPNAVQLLDKPFAKMLHKMGERSRERELRKALYYMKSQGLIDYKAHDYEHGVKITKVGRKRLEKGAFLDILIPAPRRWDKNWRLVFFDIPVEDNIKRRQLTHKLRQIGFQPLQKSIWIHPFPCRAEIEAIAEILRVRKYLTYVEISEIDAEKQLRIRFKKLFALTPDN